MFISIGAACNIKYQLDLIFGKKETLFFDWLMTDMTSVIEIFNNYNDITKLLYYDNVIQNPKNPSHNKKACIIIKSLSLCESMHDIDLNVTQQKIYDFIEKYKRRLDRIITYIKNNNDIIYFVRHGDINYDEKNKFIDIIKEINPNCNFILASLIKSNIDLSILLQSDNYICININKFKKNTDHVDWRNEQYNWLSIFNTISNKQKIKNIEDDKQYDKQDNKQDNNQDNNQDNKHLPSNIISTHNISLLNRSLNNNPIIYKSILNIQKTNLLKIKLYKK